MLLQHTVLLIITPQTWIFWIQAILGACCLAAISMLPDIRPEGATIRSLARVDWVGIVLTIPTFVFCFLPLVLGGSVYAWGDWRTLLCFGLGYAVGLPLLVYHQRCYALEPMFRAGLFCNFTATAGFVASLVQGLLLWMVL